MKLMTQAQREQLLENGRNRDQDHAPVVKWFTPDGAATWLVSELDPENPGVAFGLCDLGFGEPELGSISVAEISAIKGGFGLPVERDLYIDFNHPMSVYASAARGKRAIVTREADLAEVAAERDQETANETA